MPAEARLLSDGYGVRPAFAFLDDADGSNAFATTESLFPGSTGTVLFGLRLIREEVSQSPSGGNALIMIMAHEWGHILQFKERVSLSGKALELAADFMAGWWLGTKAVARHPALDWETAARSLFARGDFNFNSPDHHGTPPERVSAMTRGFVTSAYERVLNVQRAMAGSLSMF